MIYLQLHVLVQLVKYSKGYNKSFYLLTGIKIANGYGQSETGLLIAEFKKKKM